MQTLCQCDPCLSVIIPVYNLERWITPMLDSLKAQQLGDYKVEYIFVINCCTDNSEDVIRKSGLECKIAYCMIQGCGAARNVGFEIATGRYIWYLDGDDWLLSDTAIKQVIEKMDREDLNILRVSWESDRFNYAYFSMVWQYVFRKTYIDEFRFVNIQPCEDDEYMERVLKKARLNRDTYFAIPVIYTPLYFYQYLREGSNMYRHHILGERNIQLSKL